MSQASAPDAQHILKNIQTIADLERHARHERSILDRITDGITNAAGRPLFIVAHTLWFSMWIGLGTTTRFRAVDPFPFNLLSLLVSLEAIVLTGFVLMSQNRMSRQVEKRAHLDLQVNLLAEQELTAILQMVQQLCERSGIDTRVPGPSVEELLEKTDIAQMVDTLDRELDGASKGTPEEKTAGKPVKR